jgi:hypothetical protein
VSLSDELHFDEAATRLTRLLFLDGPQPIAWKSPTLRGISRLNCEFLLAHQNTPSETGDKTEVRPLH